MIYLSGKQELVQHRLKDSYTIIRLNDQFVSELTIGSVNLVQLPMITEPRKIDNKGLYFPYINADSTNLYLFEGGLAPRASAR